MPTCPKCQTQVPFFCDNVRDEYGREICMSCASKKVGGEYLSGMLAIIFVLLVLKVVMG